MKRFAVLVLVAGSSSLIGCSMFQSRTNASVDYAKESKRLQRQLQREKSRLEDLKHRNMVLESKLKNRKTDSFNAAPASIAEAPFPQNPENVPSIAAETSEPVSAAAVLELPKKKSAPASKSAADLGEQMIYSKIIDTYRMREVNELKKSVQILLKAYPDSVYADNALYLSGSLALESGDNAYAIKQMERLIREYPTSNKVVSALFAKAVIEKRQQRFEDARLSLLTLQKKYPGSPEAQRVSVELKLLDFTASKNKRRET